MAKASYWQRGEALDYTNTGNTVIEAGTVLEIGDRIGIAGCDIDPGALGSVHVEGVFEFNKGSGALELGENVTITASTATAAATGDSDTPNGYVAKAAASGDSTVFVKINA